MYLNQNLMREYQVGLWFVAKEHVESYGVGNKWT